MRISRVLAGAALGCVLMGSLVGCPQPPRWTPVGWEYVLYPVNGGHAVSQRPDGGYFVAASANFDGEYFQYAFAFLDAFGSVESHFALPGVFTQVRSGPRTTALLGSDGHVYVAGLTVPDRGTDFQGRLRVLKLDVAGNVLWDYTYGDEKWLPRAITESQDGCIVVSTGIQRSGTTPENVIKLDPDGNVVWRTLFPDEFIYVRMDAITTVRDGGFVTVGTQQNSSGGPDAAMWALDPDGNHLWYRRYDRPNTQRAQSVAQAPDGGFYVAGRQDDHGFYRRAYLLKTDADGEFEWDRADLYEPELGFANVEVWDMTLDDEGCIVMVGEEVATSYAGVIPVIRQHAYVMRLDPLGNLQWRTQFGGQLYGIDATTQGTYVVSGVVTPTIDGISRIRVIEVDKDGNVVN